MSGRCRVLHVTRSYYPDSDGGIERVIEHLALATTRLGVRNHVFALSPRPTARPFRRGPAVVHQQRRHIELASCSMSLTTLNAFRRRAARADVIHYHFPWPFADLMHLARASDRPALVTYHSDIVRQRLIEPLYRPLMRAFLARMGAVVATSEDYAASSPVLRAVDPERLQVVPIGLDATLYSAPASARVASWRESLGEGFFLFVGVLRYYKGLHLLLQALRTHPHRVVIVGAGPKAEALQRLAGELGVADQVTFTGYLPDEDKQALLQLCRALVFPSHLRSEAFGVSLVEAAMAGRPMITAELGTGTGFVNRDGETGIVVPPDDPEAIGRALDTLTSHPELAERLGAAARQRYRHHLTADSSARAYRALYDDVRGFPAPGMSLARATSR